MTTRRKKRIDIGMHGKRKDDKDEVRGIAGGNICWKTEAAWKLRARASGEEENATSSSSTPEDEQGEHEVEEEEEEEEEGEEEADLASASAFSLFLRARARKDRARLASGETVVGASSLTSYLNAAVEDWEADGDDAEEVRARYETVSSRMRPRIVFRKPRSGHYPPFPYWLYAADARRVCEMLFPDVHGHKNIISFSSKTWKSDDLDRRIKMQYASLNTKLRAMIARREMGEADDGSDVGDGLEMEENDRENDVGVELVSASAFSLFLRARAERDSEHGKHAESLTEFLNDTISEWTLLGAEAMDDDSDGPRKLFEEESARLKKRVVFDKPKSSRYPPAAYWLYMADARRVCSLLFPSVGTSTDMIAFSAKTWGSDVLDSRVREEYVGLRETLVKMLDTRRNNNESSPSASIASNDQDTQDTQEQFEEHQQSIADGHKGVDDKEQAAARVRARTSAAASAPSTPARAAFSVGKTGYALFTEVMVEEMQHESPGMKPYILAKNVRKKWLALSDNERAAWVKGAAGSREEGSENVLPGLAIDAPEHEATDDDSDAATAASTILDDGEDNVGDVEFEAGGGIQGESMPTIPQTEEQVEDEKFERSGAGQDDDDDYVIERTLMDSFAMGQDDDDDDEYDDDKAMFMMGDYVSVKEEGKWFGLSGYVCEVEGNEAVVDLSENGVLELVRLSCDDLLVADDDEDEHGNPTLPVAGTEYPGFQGGLYFHRRTFSVYTSDAIDAREELRDSKSLLRADAPRGEVVGDSGAHVIVPVPLDDWYEDNDAGGLQRQDVGEGGEHALVWPDEFGVGEITTGY